MNKKNRTRIEIAVELLNKLACDGGDSISSIMRKCNLNYNQSIKFINRGIEVGWLGKEESSSDDQRLGTRYFLTSKGMEVVSEANSFLSLLESFR